MIRKIKAVYIADKGQITKENVVVEICVNNKGQPDFKTKPECYGYCTIEDENGKAGVFPFVGTYTNEMLLLDFGEVFQEDSKANLETPTKPKLIRYAHILVKGLVSEVGKQIILFNGTRHSYQISKVTDLK